jgi:Ca2+-binding EF-hand superfamily protein
MNENFEPYGAFQRLDRFQSGFLTPKEFLNFLRDNGLSGGITEADCYYLVKFFDSDLDGQLHYPDFMQIVLPCSNAKLRSQATQRPNMDIKQFDYLTLDVEKDLSELLLAEIQLHRESEQLKQELASTKGYDAASSYASVDDCTMGHIYIKNLERFFNSQRRKTTEADHFAIIRRIDLDSDSKINKEEFLEAIKPQEPFSKMVVRQRAAKLEPRKPIKSMDEPRKRSSSRGVAPPKKQKTTTQFKMFGQQTINTHGLDRSPEMGQRNVSPLKFRAPQIMDGLQNEDCYKRIHLYEQAELKSERKLSQYSPERMNRRQITPRSAPRSAPESPVRSDRRPNRSILKSANGHQSGRTSQRSPIQVHGSVKFDEPQGLNFHEITSGLKDVTARHVNH